MNLFELQSDYTELTNKTGMQGDFDDILWNGFVVNQNNHIAIERFGADVPPIYMVYHYVIITDEIKHALEQSNLSGFEFCEVRKNKIIKGDWKNFSMEFFEGYDDPTYDPTSKGEHCQQTTKLTPKLWLINPLFELTFRKITNTNFEVYKEENSDFYNGVGDKMGVFISENAKLFFENLNLPLKYYLLQ